VNNEVTNNRPLRHICSLSGGKDSTALALYMRDRVPEMEYVFCDTGEELEETYEYLGKIEAYLGQEVKTLNPDRDFNHYLQIYRGVLPDPRTRWCTRMLKLRPFEDYIGNDDVVLYVGIRGDESRRKGYISTKPNIRARLPFVEDGITRHDVFRILEESGLGLPDYYNWRSRSGCYFCFFQQRREWVGLLETHPDLFKKAMAFEKVDAVTGERYTWVQGESLADLARPERVEQIKRDFEARMTRENNFRPNQSLRDVFCERAMEQSEGCTICHL